MRRETLNLANRLFKQQGLVVFVLIGLFAAFFVEGFVSRPNIINVVRQGSLVFSFSVAMTIAMLVGGLNLSIGSVGALAGAVAATQLVLGNEVLGVLLGLTVGTLSGIVIGLVIGFFNIPHFIMTYGMMKIAQGMTLIVTGGMNIYGFSSEFRFLGIGFIGNIPFPVILIIGILIIFVFITGSTTLGRSIYAVGSNQLASRFSGIPTRKVLLYTYGLSGLMAALAGVLFIARMGSAEPIMGEDWPLTAIAASVIGGTTFNGGEGSVLQTFFGAMTVAIIYNVLNLFGVSSSWQQLAIGTIIIVSILFNKYKSRLLKLK